MSYFRVILAVPEELEFDMLTAEQRDAIGRVFGQYVMPMPGTVPYGGYKIVDALTADNFHPESMAALSLNWPILGMWNSDGVPVIPLDKAVFLAHLPTPDVGDKVLHEPHRWAGWPELF